jgi:adenylate kinase family enzyme
MTPLSGLQSPPESGTIGSNQQGRNAKEIEYYTERGVLTEVNGDQSIAEVQIALIEALKD